MAEHRDIGAFDARAPGYQHGGAAGEIADRTARLVLMTTPGPRRVLDVRCRTGILLRALAPSQNPRRTAVRGRRRGAEHGRGGEGLEKSQR